MASGREVHLSDLPPELSAGASEDTEGDSWHQLLRRWADNELSRGREQLLEQAMPEFERIMIEAALAHTRGRKRDASQLLGWGRNTLTRKMKELGMP
jgi:two-component system nitrogen regulation response regulator GlnG